MNRIFSICLTFLCFVQLYASKAPTIENKDNIFRISTVGAPKKGTTGHLSWIQVKISNTSQKKIYIDGSELDISSSLLYLDGTGTIGSTIGRLPNTNADGTTIQSIHLGTHTLGIEPGESLIKLFALDLGERVGEVTVNLSVNIVASHNFNNNASDWIHFTGSTKFKIMVSKE